MDYDDVYDNLKEKYLSLQLHAPCGCDAATVFTIWSEAYLQALVDANVITSEELAMHHADMSSGMRKW